MHWFYEKFTTVNSTSTGRAVCKGQTYRPEFGAALFCYSPRRVVHQNWESRNGSYQWVLLKHHQWGPHYPWVKVKTDLSGPSPIPALPLGTLCFN